MKTGAWNKKALLAVVTVSVAAIAYGVWQRTAAPQTAPSVGYTLLNGTPAHTRELTGHVALVHFWATSCSVCRQEMPDLIATHTRFQPQGFETLAVAMAYDAPAHVVRYTEDHALPFQMTIDHDGRLAASFGQVSATPTSVLINRRGEIVERHVGRLDFTALNASIERLLAER